MVAANHSDHCSVAIKHNNVLSSFIKDVVVSHMSPCICFESMHVMYDCKRHSSALETISTLDFLLYYFIQGLLSVPAMIGTQAWV